jgi:hypothetical protein
MLLLLLFQWYAATDDKKQDLPKFVTANGFVIGSLPEVLHWTSTNGDRMKRKIDDHEVTNLLKAILAPVRPNGCVCVCLTSSRGGLPSDAVSTTR